MTLHTKLTMHDSQRYPWTLGLIWSENWPELETFEWWISGLMLNPLFFLISRLNIACSPLIFNLQINYSIGIKDITFYSFQLWTFMKNIYTGLCLMNVYEMIKPRNKPDMAFKEPWMPENGLNEFRTIVSEASSFVTL